MIRSYHTISLSEAAALFNLSITEFHIKYISTRRLKFDRLHQLAIGYVLAIYDQEKLGPWQRYKPFDWLS